MPRHAANPQSHDAGLLRWIGEAFTATERQHILVEALATRNNRLVDPYNSDDYRVTFEDEQVLIERHDEKDRPAVRVPLDVFIAALRAGQQPGA
ncbi:MULTISPECIES: hypothetical protein [Pseudomonas]|uniref:Uncharacterized protein n=1 Tax=Pseudomonas entomophila TaxID=312306 RepID=A0A3Q8U109_9PSED|nr:MULTISPECIES: hypothetical protein [Pseudomonas]AZL68136.1 hypothetical protein EJA05_10500 [Pseudomonas oryziphila]MDZ4017201.1 hypothetical protein [Pseudomonas sichuanensis]